MRNLVFKNLTSKDRTRKILLAKETFNEEGITTTIQKHLIYFVREMKEKNAEDKINPELFITKEKSSQAKTESFFVKMKAGMYANCDGKLYSINFLHSLRILMTPTKEKTNSA